MKNPLLNYEKWDNPYGSIPFNEIELKHILPAIRSGIEISKQEIEKIKSNSDEPTFENTIIPLSVGDRLLEIAQRTLYIYSISKSSEESIKIEKEVSKIVTEYSLQVMMDRDLFKRVKSVYEKKDLLSLQAEEKTILESEYKSFMRSGVHLEGIDKKKFEENQAELSELSISFDENMKKEEGSFFMKASRDDLSGLSEDMISFFKKTAKEKGENEYGFILDKRLIRLEVLPFLKSRSVREKLYKATMLECAQDNETDNKDIIKKISTLRWEQSKILGFDSYADFTLNIRMAKTKSVVNSFLGELKKKMRPAAIRELNEVSEFAKQVEGANFKIMPWDYPYYSEKLKEERYSFKEDEVKEYFSLDRVIKSVFLLANKLYGLSFDKVNEIQTWDNDVSVYKVRQGENNLGFIYMDLFMRPGEKNSGAWMWDFITQENNAYESKMPHIQLCMNLKKPEGKEPSLMAMDNVTTFLHEFGHVLHGMFSDVKYSTVAGTNVYRDFVELPSQVMENFFFEKDMFLDFAAKHYKTGESLPEELYAKIIRSKNFGKGQDGLRQLSFGIQDMEYHSIEREFSEDVVSFERRTQRGLNIFPEIKDFKGIFSTSFSHIFSGGYSAGYYGYKWAEVLDADAFEFMKENNFSKEVMESFRKNILSKGGSEKPDILYKRFRGSMPTPEAMLKRDGLI